MTHYLLLFLYFLTNSDNTHLVLDNQSLDVVLRNYRYVPTWTVACCVLLNLALFPLIQKTLPYVSCLPSLQIHLASVNYEEFQKEVLLSHY